MKPIKYTSFLRHRKCPLVVALKIILFLGVPVTSVSFIMKYIMDLPLKDSAQLIIASI